MWKTKVPLIVNVVVRYLTISTRSYLMYLWGLFGPSYGLYLLTIKPLNEDPNILYYTSMMVATLKGGVFFLLGLSCKTYRFKCHHNTKTKKSYHQFSKEHILLLPKKNNFSNNFSNKKNWKTFTQKHNNLI
jgi:hypothetical protein